MAKQLYMANSIIVEGIQWLKTNKEEVQDFIKEKGFFLIQIKKFFLT